MRLLTCFLLGALSAYSMAPSNLWIALFIGLSGLYLMLAKEVKTRSAFLSVYVFSFGYFLISLSWIGNALLIEGNTYAWAWPLSVIGLPILLSFFPALAIMIAHRFTNLQTIKGYAGFVIMLAISEWLRGHLFTGFPWNLYGYTWADILPVIQIISFSDVYFLTLLTIFWASLSGFLLVSTTKKSQKVLIGVIGVFTFTSCFAFGYARLANNPTQYHDDISIRLVQPNILQHEKWDRQKIVSNFYRMLDLSMADNTDDITTYIIWPETAISPWFANDKSSMGALKQTLQSYSGKAYLLSGVLRQKTGSKSYYNSIVLFNQDGVAIQTYDKSHLVPFGEYIPFQRFMPFGPISKFTGLKPGTGRQSQVSPDGLIYSPLVCYEILFPGQVINKGATPPDVIINVTNDAWYGISAGPHQHFTQAVFRAIEEKTPVIRSANTGFSGVIDSFGRVIYKSNLYTIASKALSLPK